MADALTQDLFKNSVTKNDMPEYQGNGVVNFMIPWFMLSQANLALPSELPPYWSLRFGVAAYWSRDLILRSTILHESFWAGAISKAATKAAAKSFELTGPRSGRFQNMLLEWGGDGYVPSMQRGMIDYLCTNNGEMWEIVRATSAAGSRVLGLVHLDSLRCVRTGDTETPFIFWDLRGQWHELKWYQVISLVDMPDPAAASNGIGHCAAERAYDKIYTVMAMETYFKEKITGTGATALDIITGLASPQIQDLLLTGSAEAKAKGFQQFQGHIIGGILANVDVKHVSIPLRELPDGYNRNDELQIAQLAYANAIGCDPQDINPALMAKGALGVGAQAVVLAEKAAGFGVAARDKHMVHIINKYLLPASVTFAFQERDLREEKQRADIALVREQTRASMITTGEITAEQARQVAVDTDDLPREFIAVDQTEGGAALSDEEKPVNAETAQEMQPATDLTQTPPTPPAPPAPPAATQKEIDVLIALKESIDAARDALFEDTDKARRGDDRGGDGGSVGGFVSGRQRRWFFAAHGGGASGTGASAQPIKVKKSRLNRKEDEFRHFKEDDDAEVHGAFQPQYKEWSKSLSSDEVKAIMAYTNGGYLDMNNALRNVNLDPSKPPPTEIKKRISNLDRAIAKAPKLHEDVMLYRGFGSTELHTQVKSGKLKKGSVITDKGFMSTSPQSKEAKNFASTKSDAVMYKIRAQKGTHGAYLGLDNINSGHTDEAEFVLPRNAKLVVVGSKMNGSMAEVELAYMAD